MRQRKVCMHGHVFYKTPGCNTPRQSVGDFLKRKATGQQFEKLAAKSVAALRKRYP